MKKSYENKTFIVEDPQARLRRPSDLLNFVVENDKIRVIPAGTSVRILDAQVFKDVVYVMAEGWGWTAATNLKGGFLNETISESAPAGNDQKGPHAAWDAGHFLKQLTLVNIVGADKQIKQVSTENLDPYLALVNAAAADGVELPLKSGFRSYPKQLYLYQGYVNRAPGFNLAAKPGFSNHQDGFAFDFAISGYEGNPRYDWLKKNGPRFGFIRTVNKEPWHWEYRPEFTQKGAYKLPRVNV